MLCNAAAPQCLHLEDENQPPPELPQGSNELVCPKRWERATGGQLLVLGLQYSLPPPNFMPLGSGDHALVILFPLKIFSLCELLAQ